MSKTLFIILILTINLIESSIAHDRSEEMNALHIPQRYAASFVQHCLTFISYCGKKIHEVNTDYFPFYPPEEAQIFERRLTEEDIQELKKGLTSQVHRKFERD